MNPSHWILPLPAVLPLAVALLCLLCPKAWLGACSRLGSVLSALAALPALRLLLDVGPVDSFLGDWAPPLGIRLALNGLTALFLIFHSLCLFALSWHRDGLSSQRFYWPLFFLSWSGLNALVLSRDLFNLYVLLELISIAAVGLILFNPQAKAVRAAMRYLLQALLGGFLYLLGVGFLYNRLGSLDLYLVSQVMEAEPLLQAGLALILAGLMIKAALFPLHTWLPPAHGAAPAPVSALLSGLVVSAAYLVILRLWVSGFHRLAPASLNGLLGLLACGSILWGGLLALRQDRLKKMLAYSTVSQTGTLFLVFSFSHESDLPAAGVWAGSIYLVLAHGFAKAAAFLAAGQMQALCGSDRFRDLQGIGRHHATPVLLLGLAGISLMGLPPSIAFVGKWLLLEAALRGGHWLLATALILGGILSMAYIVRALEICLRPSPHGRFAEGPGSRTHWPTLLLALAPFLLSWLLSGPDNLLRIGAPFGVSAFPAISP